MSKYKTALEQLGKVVCDDQVIYWLCCNEEAIRHALLIADRLMGNQSQETIQAGINSYNMNGQFAILQHFKSMRDQLVKEVTE